MNPSNSKLVVVSSIDYQASELMTSVLKEEAIALGLDAVVITPKLNGEAAAFVKDSARLGDVAASGMVSVAFYNAHVVALKIEAALADGKFVITSSSKRVVLSALNVTSSELPKYKMLLKDIRTPDVELVIHTSGTRVAHSMGIYDHDIIGYMHDCAVRLENITRNHASSIDDAIIVNGSKMYEAKVYTALAKRTLAAIPMENKDELSAGEIAADPLHTISREGQWAKAGDLIMDALEAARGDMVAAVIAAYDEQYTLVTLPDRIAAEAFTKDNIDSVTKAHEHASVYELLYNPDTRTFVPITRLSNTTVAITGMLEEVFFHQRHTLAYEEVVTLDNLLIEDAREIALAGYRFRTKPIENIAVDVEMAQFKIWAGIGVPFTVGPMASIKYAYGFDISEKRESQSYAGRRKAIAAKMSKLVRSTVNAEPWLFVDEATATARRLVTKENIDKMLKELDAEDELESITFDPLNEKFAVAPTLSADFIDTRKKIISVVRSAIASGDTYLSLDEIDAIVKDVATTDRIENVMSTIHTLNEDEYELTYDVDADQLVVKTRGLRARPSHTEDGATTDAHTRPTLGEIEHRVHDAMHEAVREALQRAHPGMTVRDKGINISKVQLAATLMQIDRDYKGTMEIIYDLNTSEFVVIVAEGNQSAFINTLLLGLFVDKMGIMPTPVAEQASSFLEKDSIKIALEYHKIDLGVIDTIELDHAARGYLVTDDEGNCIVLPNMDSYNYVQNYELPVTTRTHTPTITRIELYYLIYEAFSDHVAEYMVGMDENIALMEISRAAHICTIQSMNGAWALTRGEMVTVGVDILNENTVLSFSSPTFGNHGLVVKCDVPNV